jgi:hypothetical protein
MLIEKAKDKPLDEFTSKLCMLERNFVTSPIQETVKEVENFTQEASVVRHNWKPKSKKTTHAITVREKDTG